MKNNFEYSLKDCQYSKIWIEKVVDGEPYRAELVNLKICQVCPLLEKCSAWVTIKKGGYE